MHSHAHTPTHSFTNRAIDDILPVLLEALDDPETADNALHGLRQIMAVKSHVNLPFLFPPTSITSSPSTQSLAGRQTESFTICIRLYARTPT